MRKLIRHMCYPCLYRVQAGVLRDARRHRADILLGPDSALRLGGLVDGKKVSIQRAGTTIGTSATKLANNPQAAICGNKNPRFR